MTDRPIIFSAPMVRALLDGRKTQTRRLLKLPIKTHSGGVIYERPDMGGWEATTHGGAGCFTIGRSGERIPVPERPGIWHRTCGVCVGTSFDVGDRLYVREAWAPVSACTHNDPGTQAIADRGFYRADDSTVDGEIDRWRPSIHMPRWASRLTLFVEDVRVQRLNEISEEDAIAEGVVDMGRRDGAPYPHFHIPGVPEVRVEHDPISVFAGLWESLHGEGSWAANPWVVAVSFRVVRANIDTLGAEGF